MPVPAPRRLVRFRGIGTPGHSSWRNPRHVSPCCAPSALRRSTVLESSGEAQRKAFVVRFVERVIINLLVAAPPWPYDPPPARLQRAASGLPSVAERPKAALLLSDPAQPGSARPLTHSAFGHPPPSLLPSAYVPIPYADSGGNGRSESAYFAEDGKSPHQPGAPSNRMRIICAIRWGYVCSSMVRRSALSAINRRSSSWCR